MRSSQTLKQTFEVKFESFLTGLQNQVLCPACGYDMERAVHVGSKRIPKDVSDEAYASLFLDDEFDDAGDPNYICKGGGKFG